MSAGLFADQLQNRWETSTRWRGITRPYTADDVWRLRGTVPTSTRSPGVGRTASGTSSTRSRTWPC